jgi:hypothetical protein
MDVRWTHDVDGFQILRDGCGVAFSWWEATEPNLRPGWSDSRYVVLSWFRVRAGPAFFYLNRLYVLSYLL